MTLPEIVSREEWTAARKELLVKEKELTRARDALNAERRRLPMVEVTEEGYRFEGPEGTVSLVDLFDGASQLIVGHFMFHPDWTDGCPSCSAGADEMSEGLQRHLRARGTRLVYVSRAPLARIEDYKARKGWTFPWYSSERSTFNYDFHVTQDAAVRPLEYNYRTAAEYADHGTPHHLDGEQPFDRPGLSCFLRVGDRVFHTYSQYARGAESTGGSYYFLDLTALGRQEDWEEPKGRADLARAAVPDFAG
jgi:predicted dithiol-disulfide oxidoreductase (DUF899 family)